MNHEELLPRTPTTSRRRGDDCDAYCRCIPFRDLGLCEKATANMRSLIAGVEKTAEIWQAWGTAPDRMHQCKRKNSLR